MSKNDRVPALRDQIAYVLSNIYNDSDEEYGPDALDYRAADGIIRLIPDPHGYIAWTRRLILIAAVALTTTAIVIWF